MLAKGFFIETSPVDDPPISFVIPAHNEQNYIAQTIKALNKAIEENNVTAEIIVVNDNSSDQTASLARELGAKIVDVELRNIGAVRNAGARVATHDWIVFVDADTIVPAKTLKGTLAAMARGDVGGGARVIIDETQPLFFLKRWMYLAVVLVWQVIGRWAAGCYMFCRKDLFDSFGGFDEEYFAAEEYFFSRNLKRMGKFRLVTHPVITSARKLHRYSTLELVRFVCTPLLTFRSMLRSKKGLGILYEDDR